ncbi:MAG TPA: glutamate--cysteine ligase, partial [Actinomycetales bacterium]
MPGDPMSSTRASTPGPTPRATPGPTLGIEEELFVADATTGRLVSRGPEVQRSTSVAPEVGAVVLELTLSQVETVTVPSRDVAQVVAHSARLRSAVAAGAARHGVVLQASGTPVLGDAAEQLIAEDERYLALRTRAAGLVSQQLIAGMHVHVGVGALGTDMTTVDDDARVVVADALRPWLPTLLALSANSPYWLGTDTGFASYRQVHWQRWPVAGPPPRTHDAQGWHRSVAELVATGVVDDASYVYWDVRLASRFPTVEVRVADVQPDVLDVLTCTALVRGLAARALQRHEAGEPASDPVLDVPQHALRAAMWRAARYGLDEQLVDPASAALRPAQQVLDAMVDAARPGLEQTGDLDAVLEGVRRVESQGNGAQRQRAAFARSGWPGVLEVVRVTEQDVVPDGRPGPVPDGNGWVDCACGNRHWGRHGAAGLLAVRPSAQGPQVLLQLRSPWTHQGGTWGLPGGARDSHESVSTAARREATEETGLDDGPLVDVSEHRVDHGTWSYTYVLATAPADTVAWVANRESDAVEWVALDDVAGLPLHPALALEWPTLLDLVRRMPVPPVAADPA